jgi:hypothetical protein
VVGKVKGKPREEEKMGKKKSEFLGALGKYFEISKAVLNAVLDQGGTDDDLARILSDAELRREIARLIVAKPAKSEFPSLATAADLIPEGWTVVEDVAPTLSSAGDLEFIPVLREGEPPVRGDVMRQRAKEQNANLGLADLKRALETQAEIPAGLQGKYITFAGTVLRDAVGDLYVAYLYWHDGRWVVDFSWLDSGWGGSDRLARCK